MKQNVVGYVVKLGITLLLITAIVAGLLGAVNYITKDKIKENTDQAVQSAIQTVLPVDAKPEAVELTSADEGNGIVAVYRLGDEGYAVEVVTGGSQGNIDLMVGIDNTGAVTGVRIISHSETPGLGAVAASNGSKGTEFRDQFIGKSGEVRVTKDGGEICALTGATITSKAVCRAVSIATAYVGEVQK